MIMIIPDKYKIPDNYRRKVLLGYFSIILLFLYLFLDLIFISLYRTINENGVSNFINFTPIIGCVGIIIIMPVFFDSKVLSKKNKSTLKTHYLLICLLLTIWIFLNLILTYLKII
jgi:dolichol kinase